LAGTARLRARFETTSLPTEAERTTGMAAGGNAVFDDAGALRRDCAPAARHADFGMATGPIAAAQMMSRRPRSQRAPSSARSNL